MKNEAGEFRGVVHEQHCHDDTNISMLDRTGIVGYVPFGVSETDQESNVCLFGHIDNAVMDSDIFKSIPSTALC